MNRRPLFAMLPLLVLPAPAEAQPLDMPMVGLSALPGGGWRAVFRAGQAELPRDLVPILVELGRRLSQRPVGTGRIAIEAQASGPAEDPSIARRLSLGRAEAVRQALTAGGLAPTRVDLRPLGRTAQGLDCADILPPVVSGARAGDPARTDPASNPPVQ